LCYAPSNVKTGLYYWHREGRGSSAEVDYLLSKGKDVHPLEVKSGNYRRNRSMQVFLSEHPESPFGILLSPQNFFKKGMVRYYPLYCLFALVHGIER
ncbi:hypothetical protein ACFL5V_13605, partial [Fibrobacterota bacterium]